MTDERKAAGIDARSREFADFDQVDKQQDYRLAESDGGEEFDEDFAIRTCDLGRFLHGDERERRAFATELGGALEEIGFAILVGHGIAPALHGRAADAVPAVFERPLAEKLRFAAARHGSVKQGYFAIEETSDIHPDLVEGWVFCRRAFDFGEAPVDTGAFWPDPRIEPVFRELCQAQETLIRPLMQSILLYLGCDPHLYDARLSGTNFGLRLNYYPPLDARALESRAGRLLGHEDVDMFTLLPAPAIDGLQVLNRRNFKWVRLDAPPGSIVLNTGDYLQRISNDRLASTTHRVGAPRDPDDRRRVRVSVPMAVYLEEDEVLEVLPGLGEPKYEPIKAITFHTRTTAKFYGPDHAVE